MAISKEFTDPTAEQTSGKLSFQITDETEVAGSLSAATLTTLTLTLYVSGTLDIVNSRNAQDVLNANDVVVDSAGIVTWTLTPADRTPVGSASTEKHIALFQWSWSSGTKKGKFSFAFTVTDVDYAT